MSEQHQRKFKKSFHKSGMNKHGKGKSNKPKQTYEIDLQADDRFADFTKQPEKEPPVDMYGRLVSKDALENYVSSSDDEPVMIIPEDARPDEPEDDGNFSDQIFKRLALINQPWNDVAAQDIFQYINVFMTENDQYDDLLSVTVYLSKFGQEHPELEAPPPSEIDEIEAARWRKRGSDYLKRYFAICIFKDAAAANRVYEKLRNVGLNETDSISFELEFVDDAIKFNDFPIRDKAHSLIKDWNPPEIYSPFLTKTKNNDTWDSAPKERVSTFKAIWNATEDDNIELTNELVPQVLASSGDSENESRPDKDDPIASSLREELKLAEEEEETDDGNQGEAFQVEFVQKKEEMPKEEESKIHSRKQKKAKKEEEKQVVDETKTIQEIVEDERFADLFAKPGYGIDSSDPRFKRTPMMEEFMDVISKKHMEVNTGANATKKDSAFAQMESTVERIRRRAAEQAKKNEGK